MDPVNAVLFDWGETLIRIPGMIHDETLFVGDDLDNDVRGPRALGLRAAWAAEAELIISDLRQLPPWCNLSRAMPVESRI
jgi:FMN phosphatase YigB (HAD superfamily)